MYFLTGKTLEKDEKVGFRFFVHFVWGGLNNFLNRFVLYKFNQ